MMHAHPPPLSYTNQHARRRHAPSRKVPKKDDIPKKGPKSFTIWGPKNANAKEKAMYVHSYFKDVVDCDDYVGKPKSTWTWFPKG